jgi:uncharacterized protein (UPF0303 family)
MVEKAVGIKEDISALARQEELLQFSRFSEADAWALGSLMRQQAAKQDLPLVIDIRIAGRKLFYVALPGTSPDNAEWVERKINVVMRFHKSSYRVGREMLDRGKTLDESMGVTPISVAPHGGCFPIRLKNVGVVGCITVSGIPQREDHAFVVGCIAEFLNIAQKDVQLPPETA